MYRPNVAALLFNDVSQVLGCKRVDGGWGIVQGGIDPGEDFIAAAYRELYEETGLERSDVALVGILSPPVRYDLPPGAGSWLRKQGFIGQEQTVLLFYAPSTVSSKLNFRGLGGEHAEFLCAEWMSLEKLQSVFPPFKAPVMDLIFSQVPNMMKGFFIGPSPS